MDNIILEKDKTVLVEGNAKDKKGALADAVNKISNKVLSEEQNLVFKIEPKTFEIEKAEEIDEKEHFLFLFFPRVRKSYKVRIKALVYLEYVALADLDFKKTKKNDNEFLHKVIKGV